MPPWPDARTTGAICDICGEGSWVCAKVLGSVSGGFGFGELIAGSLGWILYVYRLRANISSTGLEVILCWKES